MTVIKHRRGTAAQWAATSRILASGEIGLELDTEGVVVGFKIGNGSLTWAELEYVTGSDSAEVQRLAGEIDGRLSEPSLTATIAAAINEDEHLDETVLSLVNQAIERGTGTEPTVTTRTNLAVDPTGAGPGGGWSTSGTLFTSTHAISDPTVTRRAGAASMKTVRAATSPSNTISQVSYLGQNTASIAAGIPVTPGKTYTSSIYPRLAAAGRGRLTVAFYRADDTLIASNPATIVDIPAGDFAPRLSSILTAPAEAAKAVVTGLAYLPVGVDTVGGEEAWWQDFLFEEAAEPGDYFDGSFTDTSTVDYAWTGAANNSTSTETTTIPGEPGLLVEPPQAGTAVSDRVLREWAQAEAWEPTVITRDDSGAVTSATVLWPDGSGGALTLTHVAGDVSTYTVTHLISGKKVTQPPVTRDAAGAVITKPALTVGAI